MLYCFRVQYSPLTRLVYFSLTTILSAACGIVVGAVTMMGEAKLAFIVARVEASETEIVPTPLH